MRSDYSCWRGWGAQSATIEYAQLILDDTVPFLFVETVYWLSPVSCPASQAYMQTGVAVSDTGETVAIIYEEDDAAYLYTPLNERLWGPTGCELLVFLCPSAAKCAKIITLWIISLSYLNATYFFSFFKLKKKFSKEVGSLCKMWRSVKSVVSFAQRLVIWYSDECVGFFFLMLLVFGLFHKLYPDLMFFNDFWFAF